MFAKSFKGLVMLSIHKSALLPAKNGVKILIRCPNTFFENLLYFDIAREQ